MADILTQEQIAEFKEAFALFDRDGDEIILRKDLGIVMRSLGVQNDADLQELCDSRDDHGNTNILFGEFLQIMARKMQDTDTEAEILEVFEACFEANNGSMTTEGLKFVLNNLGEKITDEEAEELIREADIDSDGQITYAQFVKMMMAT